MELEPQLCQDLQKQPVPVLRRDEKAPAFRVGADSLQKGKLPVLHRRKHWGVSVQKGKHRIAERLRPRLHKPQLIHQNDMPRWDRSPQVRGKPVKALLDDLNPSAPASAHQAFF